jgi:hypothetical protein
MIRYNVDPTSDVFGLYAAELKTRQGQRLESLTVRISGAAVAIHAIGCLNYCRETWELYFSQGDDAFADMDAIDQSGELAWLRVLYGATEWFTESQRLG